MDSWGPSGPLFFLCPTSPHMTMELAWWINRLSEVTSVLQVSRLESIDKMSCYKEEVMRLNNKMAQIEL